MIAGNLYKYFSPVVIPALLEQTNTAQKSTVNQLVLGIVIMQLRVATQLLLSEELMPLTSNRAVRRLSI